MSGAVRTLDRAALVVGRGQTCDWILPDAERVLSNQHLRISWIDGHYILTDTSSNGVFYNHASEPLGRDRSVALTDGDILALGDYEMAVSIGAALAAAPEPPWMSGTFQDDADDVFGVNAPPSDTRGFDPGFGSGFAPQPPATHPDHLPADREFFRPPSPVPASPAPVPELPAGGGDLWFLNPGDADLAPPLPSRSEPDALPAEEASPPLPAAPWREAAPPDVPTPAVPPMAPSATRPVADATPRPAAAESSLLAAFLEAAGLEPNALAGEDPVAVMRTAGAAYRAMVEGLRNVLAIRASLKSEFRIDRTVIGSANNNPLKFSVDAADTARQLLAAPRPGFLPPREAIRQGFQDIQEHELATAVGMQSALEALLRRFDPEALKKRLDKQSLLASILPAARRAQYWELFEAHYGQIAAEAEDDFQALFGREFAQAYQNQIRSLSADGRNEDRDDVAGRSGA